MRPRRVTVRPLAARRLNRLAGRIGGPKNERASTLVSALIYSTPEWQIGAMVQHFNRAESTASREAR